MPATRGTPEGTHVARHTLVPERDYQAALDLIVEYGLATHDPTITPLSEEAGLPGPHQAFSWDALNATLQAFREYHEQYPFRIPTPAGLGPSVASWLRLFAYDYPLPWRDEHATRHTIILGPTGGGKSTLLHHVTIAALAAGKVVKAWDLKSDLRDIAITHDFFIIGPTTIFLPLARVPYLTIPEQASITIDSIRRSFFVAENANQVLYPVLLRLWQHNDRPTIKDLYDQVLASTKTTDTYNQKDAVRRIAARLQRFMTAYPSASTATMGPTIADLNDRHVHVDGNIHLDATACLILLFSSHLYAARRTAGCRDWTHVILGDEANLIAGDGTQTVQGTSLYHDHYQLFREFGISLTLASSNRLDPGITHNAGTIVVLTSPADADSYAHLLRLTPRQTEYLARMPRGECLVRLVGYPDVIHARFAPITTDKHVPSDEWTAASERHNPRIGVPTPALDAPALPPTPEPHVALSATPMIALNSREEALLNVVADAGVTASTPAYTTAGLCLADGDRAARQLTEKGLIHRERITLHAGRGGHGIGLVATRSGLDRAGKERAVKTRGGDSVQHQYLIQELHRLLPGSTVEGMVGTKSVDLLIPLNKERDQRLLAVLAAKTSVPLSNGSLVAIEVETSAPEKTAPNNALKNHEAGITLTIVAVLPKTMVATRRRLNALPPVVQDHTLLVNVLDLLTALPSGAGGRESPS